MTTWNLSLIPGTPGTIESPGEMVYSWGANAPDPAYVGDTLYVTFPFPQSALQGTPTSILLNFSWVANNPNPEANNPNPAVLAFNGAPDVYNPTQASWTCDIIPATATSAKEVDYVFRAIVVVNQPSEALTNVYKVDPRMVVRGGGT